MKALRIIVLLCSISMICTAGSADRCEASGGADGRYKNFYSDGWFGTYALREFDKVAPVPGVNWYVDDAQDWLSRAQRDGWVVKQKPGDAVNGAIIVGYHDGLVWVGIAREVTDKGLVFETVTGTDSRPARYPMKYADLPSLIHFQGYILPQRLPGARTVSPMADYKNLRGDTGTAWPVQEFDRVAPKPGFNWQGTEKEWPTEASQRGWQVEKKPAGVKKGSLLIFHNQESRRTKVAIIREVSESTVVFDHVDLPFSRVVTTRLTVEQLQDAKAFEGFVFYAAILPERKNRQI